MSFAKKFVVLTILVALFFGWHAIRSINNPSRPQDTLIVGLQSEYPPFEFIDETGRIIGFDVDIAQVIAEKLKKKLLIKNMEFESEILSLQQGKIDLIISGMTITPSRLQEISMIPYYKGSSASLTLIFWNQIPEGIHSLEELSQRPHSIVSVETGTFPEVYIQRYPSIEARSFQGSLSPFIDVKYGKSIANLTQPDVAAYFQKKYPEVKKIEIPLVDPEDFLGFGIGVKKENRSLFQEVQQIIQELNDSGELKKLEDKWF